MSPIELLCLSISMAGGHMLLVTNIIVRHLELLLGDPDIDIFISLAFATTWILRYKTLYRVQDELERQVLDKAILDQHHDFDLDSPTPSLAYWISRICLLAENQNILFLERSNSGALVHFCSTAADYHLKINSLIIGMQIIKGCWEYFLGFFHTCALHHWFSIVPFCLHNALLPISDF
ncbi:hypothetical protein BDA99DRAFT_533869 [Phascolomyces articulosus]|uniref:Uncharacterized protein n=1 Tax=Phascolomyces articulosus TaxID=60185 RepID=A0AAD5PI05_9FUNG|nr:hypothetical protein BDA99DRAFT_533869 [Phascolomyces articulosus]